MISVERVLELIRLGNENRNVDYKGAFSWVGADPDSKCGVAKDVLAFSNTRDGGTILIGVHDETGVLEGLTTEQYKSFDQTSFNNFIDKYATPHHSSNVHRMTVDGKLLVVIDIPEFADVPILCARDANSTKNPAKLILRRGALYKRTGRATSEAIENVEEMRELLNRGLLRRQDDLLRAFNQIVRPDSRLDSTYEADKFRAEIDSAEKYFSEHDELAKQPRWVVQMHPETYAPARIPSSSDLQRLIRDSAISIRGWTFPIAGHFSAAPFSNFEDGTQCIFEGRGDRPEGLRSYKSGLLEWRSGLGEDYWQGAEGKISFIGLIYSVTEWILFAQRFFEKIVTAEERVAFSVQAFGVKGRMLVSLTPGAQLREGYVTQLDSFEIKESVAIAELRSEPDAVARKIIVRIFELFNWNNPSEKQIHVWQQKFVRREF